MPSLTTEPAYFAQLTSWLSSHATWLSWLGIGSLAMLVATPLAVPLWVASLPSDYFVRPLGRPQGGLGWARRVAAWLAGLVLVVAGCAMLVLPGQGVLTLLVGLSLLPVPGKRALLARLLARRQVARALQWMRRRAGRPDLELPNGGTSPADAERGLHGQCLHRESWTP